MANISSLPRVQYYRPRHWVAIWCELQLYFLNAGRCPPRPRRRAAGGQRRERILATSVGLIHCLAHAVADERRAHTTAMTIWAEMILMG